MRGVASPEVHIAKAGREESSSGHLLQKRTQGNLYP